MVKKMSICLNYDFKKEPYGSKKEPFLVTVKNYIYKVDIPESKVNMKLTLEELKEKYKQKALEAAAIDQMSDYGDFISKGL